MRWTTTTVGLISVACLLVLPEVAHAWGPVAHLDFAVQILSGAVALSPAIYAIAKAHTNDFLYGNLAADGIVGKNRAKAHDHCHNWDVARKLMTRARQESEPRQAMVLGYFCHLGADVVAHNHIVPQMLITHYRRKGVGHLYWEARADRRFHDINPELARIWKEISADRFATHDRFLARELIPAVFPNRLSSQLWKTGLYMQRNWPWRKVLSRIDDRSPLAFEQDDLLRWRKLSVEAGRKAMENPWSKQLSKLDPTGNDNLALATSRRKSLRRKLRTAGKDPHRASVLDTEYKQALHETRVVDIAMFEED